MRRYYFNPLIESLMQETKPLETILMPLQMYMERVRGLVTLSEATICSMYVIYAVHKRYEPIYEEGHPLRFKHEGDSLLEDLGAEALRRLYVEDMPLVVIIDCEGNNLYESGRAAYLRKRDGK